jgi:RimJ/RimL family protein N-acetyltransferase
MDPGRFRTPSTLEGRFVRLIPLALSHAAELAQAARDPEVSRYLRSPLSSRPEEMAAAIAHRLDLADRGLLLPFTTTLSGSGRVVGTTNFLRPDPPNETVEIGGTWIDSRYWRSPVNTEAKLLMLSFAFDTALAHRVYLQTDLRNLRSRQAIERLGTVPETVFREDTHLGHGLYRTSVYYGILSPEWPATRSRLEAALHRGWTSLPAEDALPPPVPGETPEPFRVEPPPANPNCLQSLPTLTGRHVTLVPLGREHIPGLAFAGRDPEVWRYLRIGPAQDVPGATALVTSLLAGRDRGEVQPFTILSNGEQRPVGIVRYLDIDRANNQVELGTWIDSTLWRTPVNTEVKYLALSHVFETEKVHRVQLRTDSRNLRSQAAIERLGAVKEGTLREYILRPGGYRRSSLCYSILAAEWPQVRDGLERKLALPWAGRPPAVTSP